MDTIRKTIYNDKKEKHNSWELEVFIPTIDMKNLPNELIGGFCSQYEPTSYKFYFSSKDELEIGFKLFKNIISKEYNIHIDDIKIQNG